MVGHIHFRGKLGVGRVCLSNEEGGCCTILIECQEIQNSLEILNDCFDIHKLHSLNSATLNVV